MNKLQKFSYSFDHKYVYQHNKIHDAIYQYHYESYYLLKRHINKNIFGIEVSKIKTEDENK